MSRTGQHSHRPRRALAALVLLGMLFGVLPAQPPSAQPALAARAPTHSQPAEQPQAYLPLVQQIDPFGATPAIWPHAAAPAPHEVALFRQTLALAEPYASASVEIFADTRYELWLDGRWIGRGPARFSRHTREYDHHSLGTLAAGPHTLAVLAQWSPNQRRSESSRPYLQLRLLGAGAQGQQLVTQSGPGWRAIVSPAWRADAAPVHAWGLIGATELLDLRALPAGWFQPGFDDRSWPEPPTVGAPPARYQARQLPTLANVPMPASVRDTGLLAPGRRIGELFAPAGAASSVAIVALANTTLTIETLAMPDLASRAIKLDNQLVAWQPRESRPDVLYASIALAAGRHSLAATPGPGGLTLGLGGANLDLGALPFAQGAHAGRRLLLAEPASQPGAVGVSSTASGLSLTFARAPAYAVIDLGRVVYGRVVAEASGPAGAVLDMGWDERLWQGARPLPYPGSLHREWNETDSWVLDGGARQISTIDARGGRYILVAAWGPAPVQLTNLRVLEERQPLEQVGNFNSSDALLNRVWQVGVDTLYPNMSDAYSDPWRERGQWWGDAFVIDHANMAAFGDSAVLARGLWQLAEAFENGRPQALAPNGAGNYMLDYGMLWAQSLASYYQRTGDTALVGQLYPALGSLLGYLAGYTNPTSGLLDIPYGDWSQTSLIDWAASTDRYGQSTAVNALYYRTLLDAAGLADALGDTAQAAAWRLQAAQVKAAANTRLYLPASGAYVATIYGGQARPATPHAQAWALANDLVPPSEQGRVADKLVSMISPDPATPNVEIYGMFWVLEGLGRAGRIAEANAIIRRYYGYMLDRGATTWWELFNSNRWYTSSLSHGWGSGPTWFLTTYVLGAQRTGPQSWQAQPSLQSLSAASGALPLARGSLQLAWSTTSCGGATIELSAPAGSSGALTLPVGDQTSLLTLNDLPVWRGRRALAEGVAAVPGGVRLELPGGRYRLELQNRCLPNSRPAPPRRLLS